MRTKLATVLVLLLWSFSTGVSANEPNYRGVAHAPGWDEDFGFNSLYTPGAHIEISAAGTGGQRKLRIAGCGGSAVSYNFLAPGRLFAAFENSDGKQGAGSCDVFLNLYFTEDHGLAGTITAHEVTIWCQRSICTEMPSD